MLAFGVIFLILGFGLAVLGWVWLASGLQYLSDALTAFHFGMQPADFQGTIEAQTLSITGCAAAILGTLFLLIDAIHTHGKKPAGEETP